MSALRGYEIALQIIYFVLCEYHNALKFWRPKGFLNHFDLKVLVKMSILTQGFFPFNFLSV